jgi:hypothetical protein
MAFARPLFTKIHQLKKQTEGVRELICLSGVEPVQQRVFRHPAGFAAEMARPFGQSADGVQVIENLFARLFQNDFVQTAG